MERFNKTNVMNLTFKQNYGIIPLKISLLINESEKHHFLYSFHHSDKCVDFSIALSSENCSLYI